jgi:plastocyanin
LASNADHVPEEEVAVRPRSAGRRNRGAAVLAALLPLFLVGCGDDADGEGTETPNGEGAAVAIVDDDGFGFEPAEVTVAAGGTVTWSHEGSVAHTVTAEDGSFDSGSLSGGDTFEEVFEDAGSYAYVCSFHPGMQGTVTVG